MELKVYILGAVCRRNFRLERCPRPKQICDHPNNEPDKISHPATASPDSRSTASRIEFATGTPYLHVNLSGFKHQIGQFADDTTGLVRATGYRPRDFQIQAAGERTKSE